MMDEKRRAVIECRHVSKTFYALSGDHLVVDDLNFNVYENVFVVLFGPGQCGKSTILNLISGLEPPTGGEILVSGERVDGPSPKRGMVYQTTNLFMWFTVMQNVEFGPKMQGVPKKERPAKPTKQRCYAISMPRMPPNLIPIPLSPLTAACTSRRRKPSPACRIHRLQRDS